MFLNVMGIVSKGAKCNVDGCDQEGARSINTTKVENAGLRVNSTGKKTILCKEHLKNGKKNLKMIGILNVQDSANFNFFINF